MTKNNLDGIELFPLYQRIVDLKRPDKAFAHEATIRGREASGRILTPAFLFQEFEAKRAVHRLDFEARKVAIRDSVPLNDTLLFLNCHGTSLNIGKVFDSEMELPLNRIVLEITEQTRINDVEVVAQDLQPYRDRGMKVALDDFGAGYSNFYLVEALNPEFIKLDRSIIAHLEESKLAPKVVEGLMAFASKMNCKIIAEGIETKGQMKILKELGVEYGQGFYLGYPFQVDQKMSMSS